MTDGNTGIPVAPAEMEDAMKAVSFFRRAAQAIVDASEYPKQIEALQQSVERLSSALDAKSLHAEQLDKSLAEVRQERDNLATANYDQATKIHNAWAKIEEHNRTISELSDKLHSTEQALDSAKAERDDYGMKLLAAEEQVADWKAKANQARDRLNEILGMFKEPEPEPKAEPSPDTFPQPVEQVEPYTPPSAESPPAPVQVEPEPEYEWADIWQPGDEWDYERGKYRRLKPRPDGADLPF